MPTYKVGDAVTVVDRPATSQDRTSRRFFDHYRGLKGRVAKVYSPTEIAVEVELESLPEDVWKRHMAARDQMRERWLDGLTPEARRKLKPDERTFELRYVVLVSGDDLKRRRLPRTQAPAA